MKKKELISLKQAAELTGYNQDYIGQLIRSGKINGQKIYTKVTWVTTAEEILAYKNKVEGITDKIDRAISGKPMVSRFIRLFVPANRRQDNLRN